MKQHLTIEEMFNYRKALDNAEEFEKLDNLDALWQPKPGDVFYIPDCYGRFEKMEELQVIKADSIFVYYYDGRMYDLKSINISACRPLFSIQQLYAILGAPVVCKVENKCGVYKNREDYNKDTPLQIPIEGEVRCFKIKYHTQAFKADELCNALWEAVKSSL